MCVHFFEYGAIENQKFIVYTKTAEQMNGISFSVLMDLLIGERGREREREA